MSGNISSTDQLASLLETFRVSAVIAVDDGDRDFTFDAEREALRIDRGETALDGLRRLDGVEQFVRERGIEEDDEIGMRAVIAEGVRSGEISLGPSVPKDGTTSALDALRSVLEQVDVPFEVVHFDDWSGPTDIDPATFVLFDFRHGDLPKGVELAFDFARLHGELARCAIFSQEPGEEEVLWDEHVAQLDQVAARQVVWIPKARLTAEPNAVVEQLAIALSAPLLRRVQEEGVGLLLDALHATSVLANDLNPYELHQLTVGSAGDGGFEPESLISLFERRSLPIAVAAMQLQPPIHTAIRQLRSVHEATVVTRNQTSGLVQLQRDDYYISRQHMVGRHQGAVAGDIFVRLDPKVVASVLNRVVDPGADPLHDELADWESLSFCVLVGQPCDLAVRPSGERSLRGRWLEALQITQQEGKDKAGAQVGPATQGNQHIFRLPWLAGVTESGHRRVVYKNVLSLPMLAVDACVWSPADAAALMVDAPLPERLSPNWEKRRTALADEVFQVEDVCRAASKLEVGQGAVAERIRLDAAASDDGLGFHFSAEQRSLSWGLVRVGRLRSPYVESLLRSYNDFRRRDAFPAALA